MFEWDEGKNQRNLEKHGIAFEDVLSVFANREALALEDKRGTMSREDLTRAVLTEDGRVLIEQPDGSYRPAAPRTDWARVGAMSDQEVEAAAAGDPDAPPLDEAFWQAARVVLPRPVRKKHTGLRIDEDVLAWFRARGPGYQTRMNAVLRAYVEAQKRGGR